MKSLLLTFLLVAFVVTGARAQPDTTLFNGFTPFKYQGAGDSSMNYRLFIPKMKDSTKRYPLVLNFHGVYEWGEDNHSQLESSNATVLNCFTADSEQSAQPAFVLAPQCYWPWQWVDCNWNMGSYSLDTVRESRSMIFVMRVLGEVLAKFPVDTDRIYLTGLSLGGSAVWDAMMRWPAKFAGGVAICGAGDPAHARYIAKIPIWSFHNSGDEVIPCAADREMMDSLHANGSKAHYTEFNDGGHLAWYAATATPHLADWLYLQKRGEAQKELPIVVPPKAVRSQQAEGFHLQLTPSGDLSYSIDRAEATLAIYNTCGVLISDRMLHHSGEISMKSILGGAPAGVYFAVLREEQEMRVLPLKW